MYKVEYAASVEKDLKAVPKAVRLRALNTVEKILCNNPHQGKPLAGSAKGLFKYRIGDFRIIYSIEQQKLILHILRIRHRKDVYRGL